MITLKEVVTFDHLVESYFHCRKGKSLRQTTVLYHIDYAHRLHMLEKQLLAGIYVIKDLYSFIIYEPKKRNITANQFEDKIVQRLICEYALKPVIQPKLIYDNYASQPNKGTHLALHRLQKFMISYAKSVNWDNRGWVLVCDVRKFFYTIDRSVCYNLVTELPLDDGLKQLIYNQIYACGPEYNEYTDDPDKGLCIGFQTSQWLAVYYLNKLDHMIKETLHIKAYGRYMDDFYLIHEDRDYLEYCYGVIKEMIETDLHMKLNPKTHIHPFSQGVCFLGYHCTYNTRTHQIDTVVRSKSIRHMEKHARILRDLIQTGRIDRIHANQSIDSWYAYAKHGNSNKSKNAYYHAKELINGKTPDWNDAMYYGKDKYSLLDKDGFLILQYRPDFRNRDGFLKLCPKVETMREYCNRIGTPIQEDDIETVRKKKRDKKIIDSEKRISAAALNINSPKNATHKKKKGKKSKPYHIDEDSWEWLDQYRGDDGFVILERKNPHVESNST